MPPSSSAIPFYAGGANGVKTPGNRTPARMINRQIMPNSIDLKGNM